MCVGAAAAQFGAELRLREAAHEQTLVARYAEKEAARALKLDKACTIVVPSTEPRGTSGDICPGGVGNQTSEVKRRMQSGQINISGNK